MTLESQETSQCGRCSTLNDASNRFCFACGAPLGPEWQAYERIIDDRITDRVRQVIKENFSDQKTLEIETTELIVERTAKWARTFGFFVGVPLAVVALVLTIGGIILGIVGIKTWSDINEMQKALADSASGLTAARAKLEDANAKAETALADANKFKQEISDDRELLESIPALQQRTKALEGIINLPSFKKKYFESLGFNIPEKLPSVTIENDKSKSSGINSYYDPSQDRIVVDEQAVNDPSVVLREFMHHILFTADYGRISNSDILNRLYPIESFLAFYIPASYLNNPKIGSVYYHGNKQGFLYNLEGISDFSKYDMLSEQQKPYQGAEILGRLFWELRETLKIENPNRAGTYDYTPGDKLVIMAWKQFVSHASEGTAASFLKIYIQQFDRGEPAKFKAQVERVFQDHHVPG